MAITFPAGPVDGDITTAADGRQYKYVAAKARWQLQGGFAQITEVKPTSPRNGEIHFDRGTGTYEVYEESTTQWVGLPGSATGSDFLFNRTPIILNGEQTPIVNQGSYGLNFTSIGVVSVDNTNFYSGSGSLSFPGTNNAWITYFNSPYLDGLVGEWTWEAWIRIPGAPTTLYGLFFFGDTNSNEYRIQAGIDPTRKVNFYTQGATGQNFDCESTTAIAPSTWTHVACTKLMDRNIIFINGQPENFSDSYISTLNTPTIYTNADTLIIGGARAGGSMQEFAGNMDGVRFTNYPRYTAPFIPPTTIPLA